MITGHLKLTDGRALATRTWTPALAAGDAVLLLHGVESHAGWFEELGPELAGVGLTAFAYDRWGWGVSGGPRGRLASPEVAVAEMREAVAALAAAHTRVHLLGLSWGGLLAAHACAALPHAFASVTLVAPGILTKLGPAVTDLALAALSGGRRDVPLPFLPQDFTQRGDRQAWIAADDARTRAVGLDFCLATLKLRLAVRRGFGTSPLPPTQVLLAERDTIVDTRKTRLFAERRGARVTVLAGAAHSLVFEDPRTIARSVRALAPAADVRPVHAS